MHQYSYEVSDSSAYNNILSDNECESVSDSNGEDRNRVAEECSPIAVEDLPEEHLHQPISLDPVGNFDGRSEERRVGKECSS